MSGYLLCKILLRGACKIILHKIWKEALRTETKITQNGGEGQVATVAVLTHTGRGLSKK